MYRKEIVWSVPPTEIRVRGCTSHGNRQSVPSGHKSEVPQAASFPNGTGQPVAAGPPPPPDIRPLLESISAMLAQFDQRRQQTLSEMQQVAVELAIAVASHLVFDAIAADQHAVEELVRQAIHNMGLDSSPTISLHPKDLELLQKRLAKEPASWNTEQLTLRPDPSIARGGCRIENSDGRQLVSDISSRLSEIRRHWMEGLDDSQVERRGASRDGHSLRRFPDRRETA